MQRSKVESGKVFNNRPAPVISSHLVEPAISIRLSGYVLHPHRGHAPSHLGDVISLFVVVRIPSCGFIYDLKKKGGC